MIVVRLFGGLGNQMFQYAFALSLSKAHKQPFFIDTREFQESCNRDTLRFFELNKYNISAQVILKERLSSYKLARHPLLYRIFRKLAKKLPFGFLGYYREQNFSYDNSILKTISTGYIDGHWQSYKYFENFRTEIVLQFRPQHLDNQNQKIANQISTSNAVSLHVRRGDYITNQHAKQHHGSCTLDYYYNAIKKLEKNTSDLHFFLFSDDPKWVQENLKINHPLTIMDFNGAKNAHLDMFLMTFCKYHIIANSSFSWWGAWLSNSPDKKVYAPKNWFNSGQSTDDLIPEEWERIE